MKQVAINHGFHACMSGCSGEVYRHSTQNAKLKLRRDRFVLVLSNQQLIGRPEDLEQVLINNGF